LASAVSHQRFTQEFEDGTLLLAAGFDHGFFLPYGHSRSRRCQLFSSSSKIVLK
jgi:hypothetical protein